MAFCWSGQRPHGILRELFFWGGAVMERRGVIGLRYPGPQPRPRGGHLRPRAPSTLRQAGRREEGAPRGLAVTVVVSLSLRPSSRAIASRGASGLRGGGGQERGFPFPSHCLQVRG